MKLQNTQAGMHDLTTRKYQTKQYSELPTAKANQTSKPKMTTTTLELSFANTQDAERGSPIDAASAVHRRAAELRMPP